MARKLIINGGAIRPTGLLYNYPYTLIQNIFKYHLPQVGTHSTWFLQYQSSNTIYLNIVYAENISLGSDHLTSKGGGGGFWSGWNIFFTCFQRQKFFLTP